MTNEEFCEMVAMTPHPLDSDPKFMELDKLAERKIMELMAENLMRPRRLFSRLKRSI